MLPHIPDITWTAHPNTSTQFTSQHRKWELKMTHTALSLDLLDYSEFFCMISLQIDEKICGYERHFPTDGEILVFGSFKESHVVKVGVRMGRAVVNYFGIVNLGATCYFNTLIQVFYYLRELRKQVVELNQENDREQENSVLRLKGNEFTIKEEDEGWFYKSFKNSENSSVDKKKGELSGEDAAIKNSTVINEEENSKKIIFHLCNLFNDLENRSGAAVPNKSLIPWQICAHEDIQEYFHFLMDHLPMVKIFNGSLNSIIKTNCGCGSKKEEEFKDLSLEITSSIEESLKSFFTTEEIEGFRCEHGETTAFKTMKIKTWPKVLMLNIKRVDFQQRKLNEYCAFPHVIERQYLSKFCDAGKLNSNYILYAVVVHEGSTSDGHYYCFVKIGNKWYKFNDSVVTRVNEQEIDVFGGFHPIKGDKMNYSAYCLFYVKESDWDDIFSGDQKEGNFKNTHLESGIFSKILDTNKEFGKSYFFSISDIPRFVGPTLFSDCYPKVNLRTIKTDVLYRMKTRISTQKYVYTFEVAENETKYMENGFKNENSTFFYVASDNKLKIEEKKLFFIKKFKPEQTCPYVMPLCFEIIDFILLFEHDFMAINHYKLENGEIVFKKAISELREDIKEFFGSLGSKVVLDGIYVVVTNSVEDYFYAKGWFERRRLICFDIFVERKVKVSEIEKVVQMVLMEESLAVNWNKTIWDDSHESGDKYVEECKLDQKRRAETLIDYEKREHKKELNGADSEENKNTTTIYFTAKSHTYKYNLNENRSIDCIKNLSIITGPELCIIHVGLGQVNSCDIFHSHPVVIENNSRLIDIHRRIKRLKCINADQRAFYVMKNSFLMDELKNGTVVKLTWDIELQNTIVFYPNGEYLRAVHTVNYKAVGFPFLVSIAGIKTVIELINKYRIDGMVLNYKNKELIVLRDSTLLTSLDFIAINN